MMLSLIAVVLAALTLTDAGDVLTLIDSDFDSRLADLDLTLVKFYAPWYVHLCIYQLCSMVYNRRSNLHKIHSLKLPPGHQYQYYVSSCDVSSHQIPALIDSI